MPNVPIRIPTLVGGVTRSAQPQRSPITVEEADNVIVSLSRGLEKRAGTVMVDDAALTAAGPTRAKHVGWIDRSLTERFVYLIDPAPTRIDLSTDMTVGPPIGGRIRQAVTLAEGIVVTSDVTLNRIWVIPVPATGTFNNTNTISDISTVPTMAPTPVTPTAVTFGANLTDVIEVFNVTTGAEVTVNYPNNIAGPQTLDPYFAYISFSFDQTGADPRRRLRSVAVADTVLILNKLKLTALRGRPITYRLADLSLVRQSSNAHNVASWAEFDHPPTATGDPNAIPIGESNESNANFDSDGNWYAEEDDVGQPQGFYLAVSLTQPPWFVRVRTEPANSVIDERTMPVRLDFNGVSFTPTLTSWRHRFSGDSATNPGPSFIGLPLTDLAFHQGRLFLSTIERVASSQAGDFFNLWIESEILTVDSDPVDLQLTTSRSAIVDSLSEFREALILTTSAAKQFELRADGPLSPNTAFIQQSTSIKSVDYVHPITLGDQLYFMGERNFANVLYEYLFDPNSISNMATDVTEEAEGYIPAEVSLMEPSEAHNVVFMLTDAETNAIYVYKSQWRDRQSKLISALYRWTLQTANNILSCKVYDESLILLIRRNSLLWLEQVSVEQPEDDVVGLASMGFQVRLDSKLSLNGTYNVALNQTTWTVPYEDAGYTNIVLGPGWDEDSGGTEQRLAGTRFVVTPTVGGGTTTLVVTGQYATNIAGDAEIAYVGKPFEMLVRLSEQFVRDQDGTVLNGNVKLLSLIVNHKDTGFYAVEITALNRDTIIKEFIFPRTGSTALDAEFVEDDGQLQCRIMGKAHSTQIDITNDSPLPSNIIDLEFKARFVPKRDPTR